MLTNFESDEDVYRAVSAGAQGYLLKSTTQREMIEAIRTVYYHQEPFLRTLQRGLLIADLGFI